MTIWNKNCSITGKQLRSETRYGKRLLKYSRLRPYHLRHAASEDKKGKFQDWCLSSRLFTTLYYILPLRLHPSQEENLFLESIAPGVADSEIPHSTLLLKDRRTGKKTIQVERY